MRAAEFIKDLVGVVNILDQKHWRRHVAKHKRSIGAPHRHVQRDISPLVVGGSKERKKKGDDITKEL